jgi:glycosyltransferase involved in cell wall biosynthesis
MTDLSICIPTMKCRKKSLDKVMLQLAEQCLPYIGEEVEICISSHDGELTYDQNIEKVIRQAKGEWVWEVCDDDDIEPGAVARVLSACCQAKDEDAIFVNHKFPNGKAVCQPSTGEFLRYDRINNLNLSFGGACCFRRIKAIETIDRRPKKLLDEFLHTYIFIECAKSAGYIYIPVPCIWVRASEAKITIAKRWHLAHLFRNFELDCKYHYGLEWKDVTFMTPFNLFLIKVIDWLDMLGLDDSYPSHLKVDDGAGWITSHPGDMDA